MTIAVATGTVLQLESYEYAVTVSLLGDAVRGFLNIKTSCCVEQNQLPVLYRICYSLDAAELAIS
jgi:hypothetical protein